ncbi:MAG: hypothetical protein IJS29_00070 [Selenomonadaceae bacterium]|nr:hypothetical protein [Selenomonadaceae bacterium]
MTTVTSAANTTITGTAENDIITSSGDGVTISALGGEDYVIARGLGSFIYGSSGNDTLILLPSNSTATTSGAPSGGARAGARVVSADTEIHGNSGNDDIVVVHDSANIYGDAGNDYMTVRIYESAGEFLSSINNVTLTGGDGNDTFAFSSYLPSEIDTVSTVSGYRIEASITDFSSTAHLAYDSNTSYFVYSYVTDSIGNYTDVILRDNSDRLSITLEGVTNIDDVVYARAVRFVEDTVETAYLGEVLSNYTDDMSVIPAGITYNNYTVYVSDSYARNVWLLGTDEVNHVSTYRNITARTLDARSSTRKRTLVGNYNTNAIYAGSGGDSMWGGNSANDTLFGNNGQDMFWYGVGDGGDFIRNFAFGSTSTSDILNLYSGGIERGYRLNNAIHILMTSGEELVIPTEYSVDTEIQYSTDATTINRAKIGEVFTANTLTYDAAINLFMGGAPDNTLKVADERKNMIWLDGSYGQNYYEITNIDASESTGDNQLAGAVDSNINIIGGAGNTSMWGGIGRSSNDTLQGGSGTETFFYGQYEGNDIIIGATEDDTVKLYNISFDDLTSTDTVSGGMTLNFKNGDYSLTLQDFKNSPTFSFANGGNKTYEKGGWVTKE